MMSNLSHDQAFQVSALIRKLADDCDKRAVDFDQYENPDRKFHPNSIEWAKECRAQLRIDAEAYRQFAREILEQSQ